MKKIIALLGALLVLGGCDIFSDSFGERYVTTTIYPITYATNMLYNSNTRSIYPNESDISEYTLTSKQNTKYANSDIFIYAGKAKESTVARDLLNINNNLKIIDATKGMNYENHITELWLDPSNFLMICRNIKEGLIDYNDNAYAQKEIEDNYNKLKEEISELDVSFYNLSKNGKYNTMLIANDAFKYLNKYNINTISLTSTNINIDKAYAEATTLIEENKISYIYKLKGDELDEKLTKFITEKSLTVIEIEPMFNLTNEEYKNNEDYITLLKKVIVEYKKELYKQ